ncbi:MAG: YlbE-like family protein [bacterium]|nr:YlbE-like family protein [bacterium]
MNINTQYKIKGNLNNLRYLREKSYWYKYLNRSYEYLKYFEDEMKKAYKLTPEDRMKKMADGIDSLSKIMDILS